MFSLLHLRPKLKPQDNKHAVDFLLSTAGKPVPSSKYNIQNIKNSNVLQTWDYK